MSFCITQGRLTCSACTMHLCETRLHQPLTPLEKGPPIPRRTEKTDTLAAMLIHIGRCTRKEEHSYRDEDLIHHHLI